MQTSAWRKNLKTVRYPTWAALTEHDGDVDYASTQARLMRHHLDMVRVPYIQPVISVFRPEHAQRILLEKVEQYTKTDFVFSAIRKGLGHNILTNPDFESWAHLRRQLQTYFYNPFMELMRPSLLAAAARCCQRIDKHIAENRAFDFGQEALAVSFDIVQSLFFNGELKNDAETVIEFGNAAVIYASRVGCLVPWLPIPSVLRFRQARERLHFALRKLFSNRQQNPTPPQDLLKRLLDMREYNTNEPFSEAHLFDEMKILLTGGFETTANAMTWFFYHLDKHPDAERKVHDEVSAVLKGKLPTYEQQELLQFTHNVYQESIRLFPPIWLYGRRAEVADNLDGYYIPRKAHILICSYAIHRHPEYWENADEFHPERFEPEASRKRPKFAYFPFGAGPRVCLGNTFSVFQALYMIPLLCQRYRFRRVTQEKIKLDPFITLQMRGGLQVRAEKRDDFTERLDDFI